MAKKKGPWPVKLQVTTIRLFADDIKRLKIEAEAEGLEWQVHTRRRLHRALKSKGVVQ